MADTRRIIEVYFDVNYGRIVDVDGRKLTATNEFRLYRNTETIVRAHLITAFGTTNTYLAPPASTSWFFGIDNDYDESADLVVTQNTDFNINDDWSSLSAEAGKICWRIDTTTSALKIAMGTSEDWAGVCELWMTPPGVASVLIAQWDCTIDNIVTEIGTSTDLTYYSNNIVQQVGQNDVYIYYADGSVAAHFGKP